MTLEAGGVPTGVLLAVPRAVEGRDPNLSDESVAKGGSAPIRK